MLLTIAYNNNFHKDIYFHIHLPTLSIVFQLRFSVFHVRKNCRNKSLENETNKIISVNTADSIINP